MKKYFFRAITSLVVCGLAGVAALASGKTETIRFQEGFSVNGTRIEKGSYRVSYDEQAGELSIKDGDGKLVAKSKARAEQGAKKNANTTFTTESGSGGRVLRSVSFAGERQRIVVGDGDGSAASTQ